MCGHGMNPEGTWSATWRSVLALVLLVLASPFHLALGLWDGVRVVAHYMREIWRACRVPGAVTIFGRHIVPADPNRPRPGPTAPTICLILALLSAPSLAAPVNVRIEDEANPPGQLTYILYRLDGAAWVPVGEVSRGPAGNVSVGTIELPTGRYRLKATARWGTGTNVLESATGPEATATVRPLGPSRLEVGQA
jgi:hypothetical protein